MYVVRFEAEIGDNRFIRLHSVEIEKSMKQIGSTALLKLPTTARLERRGEFISEVEVAKEFSVGDPIVIRLGYGNRTREEFRGFVRRIHPTTPLEIECEDEVYLLRRKRVQKSFRNVTLAQLINYIVADTGIEIVNTIPTVNFAKFSFLNVNAAQALEKLKKDYGLTIYFRSFGQMVVGLASESDGVIVKYTIGQNVIQHSLEYEDEENVRLKIQAVNVLPNNEFVKQTVGDPDGEQRTVYFYNLGEDEDLKQRAEEELIKYRYSGYKGDLTGFLLPACDIGNTVRFKDDNFENPEGDYLVESVTTSLSDSGGRRKVKLGLKLN